MLSAWVIRGFSTGWLCLWALNGMNISNGMMVMPSGFKWYEHQNGMMVMPSGKMVMLFGTIGFAFDFGR